VIGPDASVDGSARVDGSAVVTGSAVVADSAVVDGSARVTESAVVDGSARVTGSAIVTGSARVTGSAIVDGSARVTGGDLLHGHDGCYSWTAYLERNDSTGRLHPVLQYGCERHRLSAWTVAARRRMSEEHGPEADEGRDRVLHTVRAFFRGHPRVGQVSP
jgi:carbonic anhydrase/acetyltransferase-like protein (isoleucine patch superfamily)